MKAGGGCSLPKFVSEASLWLVRVVAERSHDGLERDDPATFARLRHGGALEEECLVGALRATSAGFIGWFESTGCTRG